MKIAVVLARVLLGLLFFVFGLNTLHSFRPVPPMPPSDATTFATLLMTSHYMTFVGVLMTIAGLLLLIGRFVPLALVILGPILVNILSFHFFLMHGGAGMGIGATVLELFLIWAYRLSFRGLFDALPERA
jgi:putative oxidoreductase